MTLHTIAVVAGITLLLNMAIATTRMLAKAEKNPQVTIIWLTVAFASLSFDIWLIAQTLWG